MTSSFFRELFEYNFATNQDFISILTKEEKVPAQAISFFDHILNAHQIWLQRVKLDGETFSTWQNHAKAEWPSINQYLFQRTLGFLEASESDFQLTRIVKYQNSKGDAFENTLQDIYFHIINHGTHHRSQIALLLRQHDIAPPVSDYIFYKR